MTALRAEGCGGGFAAIFIKKGRGSAAGCVERGNGPSGRGLWYRHFAAMSIIMPPFGGHAHIEYYNHSYPRTLPTSLDGISLDSRVAGLPYEFSSLAHPSPLRGPLPLKGTQERYGIYFSVSYDMISITAIATKRGNCGMVHEIYDSLFFLSILLVSP